jgi:hypothetical protein
LILSKQKLIMAPFRDLPHTTCFLIIESGD